MADSKNAFAAIAKDPHASWNINRKTVLNTISKSTAVEFKNNVLKKYTDKDLKQKKSRAYDAVIGDIKSALSLPKEPAREDFIGATKKIEEVQKVLEDALKEKDVVLDRVLIDQLLDFVQLAATALDEGTPFLGTAAFKTVKDKAKATGTNIASGLVSQLTQGIPFAPEMINFAGAKIKSALGGGGASSSAKEMASLLKGASDDGGNGDAEDFGGAIDTVEKAKEEILGGTSTGGGAAGGGLEFTNELLISIEDHLDFIRKNTETAETRREDKRKKDAQQIAAIKKMGGAGAAGLAGAGAAGAAAEGLDWMDLLIFDRAKSFFDKKGLIPKFFGGSGGKTPFPGGPGFGGVKPTLGKGVLSRLAIVPHLARLGPLLLNPWVLGAVAVGGLAWWLLSGDDDDDEKPPARKKTKSKTLTTNAWGESISRKGLPEHAKGIVDVKKDHIAMIHEGETILDNEAALDFKEGAKILGGIASHEKGLAGPLDDKKTGAELRAEAAWEARVERYGLKDAKKTNAELRAEGEYAIDVSRFGKEEVDRRKRLGLTGADLRAEAEAYTKSMEWAGKSKTAMETLEHLQKNFGVELMKLHDFVGGATVEEMKKQGYIGQMFVPSKFSNAVDMLGYLDYKKSDKESKWAKGLDELYELFSTATTSTVLHQLAGVKSWQQLMQVRDDTTKKEEEFSEALYALGIDFDAGKSKLHKATREEGGRLYPGLQGRMKRGDNPLFNVMQNVESMNLSQLLDLQHAIKNFAKTRESVKIAEGHMLAKEAVWGGDISGLLGSDKDRFTTEFGKNYSATNTLRAKGTGLGMTNPLKSLLAESSAAVQKLIGGSAIYKSTDASVYDARNFQKAIPRAQYGMGVAGSGLIFADKGEEVLEAAEVAAIGSALNNAAKNRIGIDRSGGGGSPNVIDTSSTQVVNNTTIIPPIEPNGPALPFGYANARV